MRSLKLFVLLYFANCTLLFAQQAVTNDKVQIFGGLTGHSEDHIYGRPCHPVFERGSFEVTKLSGSGSVSLIDWFPSGNDQKSSCQIKAHVGVPLLGTITFQVYITERPVISRQ